MLTLTEKQIVVLLVDKLRGCATKVKSGTANVQDPTHFESIRGEVGMNYGFDIEGNSELVTFKVDDCTWGVEFEFTISEEAGNGSRVMRAYFDFQDSKWISRLTCPVDEFCKVAKRIMVEGVSAREYQG